MADDRGYNETDDLSAGTVSLIFVLRMPTADPEITPEVVEEHGLTPEEFARMSAVAENDNSVAARERRVFLRQLHSRAQHGVADKQGRLVLPEDLCRKIGLKGEVALVGGRGRFEIWNVTRWKRAHEEETPTYQHVANVIGL